MAPGIALLVLSNWNLCRHSCPYNDIGEPPDDNQIQIWVFDDFLTFNEWTALKVAWDILSGLRINPYPGERLIYIPPLANQSCYSNRDIKAPQTVHPVNFASPLSHTTVLAFSYELTGGTVNLMFHLVSWWASSSSVSCRRKLEAKHWPCGSQTLALAAELQLLSFPSGHQCRTTKCSYYSQFIIYQMFWVKLTNGKSSFAI